MGRHPSQGSASADLARRVATRSPFWLAREYASAAPPPSPTDACQNSALQACSSTRSDGMRGALHSVHKLRLLLPRLRLHMLNELDSVLCTASTQAKSFQLHQC
eukprot:CAMPEP_0178413612 /NCGR_PEP_ID=MMETSP0689_2-20121128/22616_1 /TAXON_ID=160604 /ORGANISM="Amphidinium massartii, Strain CS-259" /LENGTH=103 /DNA_ID=CAMNT_0020034887 /DNA_START=445 /DNA_END=756 /DNA_ORIENTATION=+